MKKFITSAMAVFALLIICQTGHSAVIWQENFDGFTQDYNCSSAVCTSPPGYVGFMSNTECKNYGLPNAQIAGTAERSYPGQTNKRGFRINLEEQCWPTGENLIRKDLGKDYNLIYIRWYQRDSYRTFQHFQKLFRFKKADGNQNIIPMFYGNGSNIQMGLWDAQTASVHFFTGYNLNTQYTVGTWVSYEIKLDLVNRQAEFWVNGVSKGKLDASSWWPAGWTIRNVEIGGNQYGHPWTAPVEHHRDYDDIVISTSYVGPSGPPASGVPIPKNLTIVK